MQGVELLKIDSALKRPIRWIAFVVDKPFVGKNIIPESDMSELTPWVVITDIESRSTTASVTSCLFLEHEPAANDTASSNTASTGQQARL